MLLTFCLIAYSVFGWTPAEFEGKIGLYAEYLKEAKEETRDKVKLFGWSIGPIGPSLASNYLGVWYPNSPCLIPTEACLEKMVLDLENDNEVQDGRKGRKVLVVTGWPLTYGRRMEIIDLGNKHFTCARAWALPNYPSKLMGGTGGLIANDTIMICGGFPSQQKQWANLPGDCFKLQPQKSKDWIKVSDLAEPRYFSGSGNVVLDGGKLLVHGGSNIFLNPFPRVFYGQFYLSNWILPRNILPEKWYPEEGYASTELVATNSDASFTSAFSNQTMVYQHCNIQINSTTFMVTGGIQSSHCFGRYSRDGMKTFESPGCNAYVFMREHNLANINLLRKTYFVNIKSGLKQKGPLLKIGRFNHGCERIEVNGASLLIIAGGEGRSERRFEGLTYLSSMEYLDLSKLKNGWKLGPDLPFGIGVPKLVASLDRSSLYAIGGEAFGKYKGVPDKKINMGILEYHCKGQKSLMKECQWKIMDQQLNHYRLNSIAIMIPDSMANILCMKK